MAGIRFSHVSKAYPDGHLAVNNLSLDIADGEFLALVGPSGCGKSTALRMIAGLEDISGGVLSIGGIVANGLSPRKRNVAMIFQSYALYPHLSVAENLGFALKVRGEKRETVEMRVGEAAAMLELQKLLARRPGQLSGGQRQRVAMGRALVRRPQAFLMDEPLSNLDARLRGQMRVEIAELQRAAGVTTVYVTHDQIEAMTMGDRVAVMRDGVLQQLGAPRELYDRPANLFVATFIGSPPMNLLQGAVRRGASSLEVEIVGGRLALPQNMSESGLSAFVGHDVIVGVRPEAVRLVDGGEAGLPAVVAFEEDLGASVLTTIELAGLVHERGAPIVEELGEADIPRVSHKMRVSASSGTRRARGAEVRAICDEKRLYLFDPASKRSIV